FIEPTVPVVESHERQVHLAGLALGRRTRPLNRRLLTTRQPRAHQQENNTNSKTCVEDPSQLWLLRPRSARHTDQARSRSTKGASSIPCSSVVFKGSIAGRNSASGPEIVVVVVVVLVHEIT